MNLAPLPAALELRIPPQKESTPTPRVTHLPAPLPRTHTALTLCSRHRAVGRQPGTRQGASPGPLPREKIASTARTGTLCHKYAFPTTGIVSKLSAPAPHAEASYRPSPSPPPQGRALGARHWPWPAWPSWEGACAWWEQGWARCSMLQPARPALEPPPGPMDSCPALPLEQVPEVPWGMWETMTAQLDYAA